MRWDGAGVKHAGAVVVDELIRYLYNSEIHSTPATVDVAWERTATPCGMYSFEWMAFELSPVSPPLPHIPAKRLTTPAVSTLCTQ